MTAPRRRTTRRGGQSGSRTVDHATTVDNGAAPVVERQSAVRAWVEPRKRRHRGGKRRTAVPWRPQPYGQRVLVFDTETTTDTAQRLLYGFFRIYDRDRLVHEGLIAAEVMDPESMALIAERASKSRLPIYSRERFVEEVFYPEVYREGTLCVGFNLPFDLTRIAVHAGVGRGQNRRKFRIVLTRRIRWHDLRIESATGKAAFIGFTPKRKLQEWERPFFAGRFCDLSTLSRAFSGKPHSLRSAGKAFGAFTLKMRAPELGGVTREALVYGRQDVRATYALFKALRDEYERHPFATFADERSKPDDGRYMGQLYSTASVAKQYLRLLGIAPFLEKQPTFSRKVIGWFMAAYYGGRADVRVRKVSPFVSVVDFTSMYPTIFCLQRLDLLLTAPKLGIRTVTREIRTLVGQMASGSHYDLLFDPTFWRRMNCLVLVEPNGATLPIRMREHDEDPYTIAVTPIDTPEPRWYTLTDVLASVLLGTAVPKIRKAIRIVPKGRGPRNTVPFRNEIDLHSNEPFFKTVVERRQIAKAGAKGNRSQRALDRGLKELAAGGAYGIYAEINVSPRKDNESDVPGMAYSDIAFEPPSINNERPGAYTNPILATLVTGGARLMLALAEREVTNAGGTYAFCDTDSLAIVRALDSVPGIPGTSDAAIDAIVKRFNRLNPYNPQYVPNLLKVEYPQYPDLRCYAVSAKRYVLYRVRPGNRIQIVKASESGLGAIIGRSSNESTSKLARRIWLSILMAHIEVNPMQRRRAKALIDFDVPLRRKFQVAQPAILERLNKTFNKDRNFDLRVKPFGFVQTVVPDRDDGSIPMAPFEKDVRKSMRLPWVDFKTGNPVRLDWHGTAMAEAIGVTHLSDYIKDYQDHPESKASDSNGYPAGRDTIQVLGRLRIRSMPVKRIGKEVDRLSGDDGATLDDERPFEYERNDLSESIDQLSRLPRGEIAKELGVSERAWRSIVKGAYQPRPQTYRQMRRVAEAHRRQR
jgi:hypothetical protein